MYVLGNCSSQSQLGEAKENGANVEEKLPNPHEFAVVKKIVHETEDCFLTLTI